MSRLLKSEALAIIQVQSNIRDNLWLLCETKKIWKKYFSDQKLGNEILVVFSRKNKCVLGSIKFLKKKKVSLIRINGYFRNEEIPLSVLQVTLAHELAHYIHGFSSEQRKLYRYPHQGGVIKKEFRKRGLLELELKSKKWLKENWKKIINSKYKSNM